VDKRVKIKIALPKGHLLPQTANLLQKADLGLVDYHESARLYRLKSQRFPRLSARIFHEKDIPIQVAVGNYDLGICRLDWVEELLARYPDSALVKVKSLGFGEDTLQALVCQSAGVTTMMELQAKVEVIRIASEYPNLAETFALNNRLKRFSIFPLWGAAEVYPPESAELALVTGKAEEFYECGLVPITKVLTLSAFLIANKNSWITKDLSEVVASICDRAMVDRPMVSSAGVVVVPETAIQFPSRAVGKGTVRLALPDGHQQKPTISLLNKAGIHIDDYPSATGNRRPMTDLPGVVIKVIRPQDMPLQVANGNFDLAITGRDWLREHLYRFPSSPVTELVDLKFGWVRIVAAVHNSMSVDDAEDLRQFATEQSLPLRVASEYVNIADKYSRDNHIGMYWVIPTWGASEAFLPEDADVLIENTETGGTLARHNLKIIDTLFESTACLVGNTDKVSNPVTGPRIESIVNTLRQAVKEG
jgi:ATP phosphoribosyltransferase